MLVTQTSARTAPDSQTRPWPALFALCLGFFMIMVDTTIVSVATPSIMADLDAGVNSVIWVTSGYLLAYAVPILITGRLGDRFGPKRIYQIGLAVFTLASLWCGLTTTIEMLIVARVFQGFGASMMTPQTMAVITRIFPANDRGQAMALWGATAGVAMLVGPLLGGVLIDAAGWEWIFFVNVPIGIVAFLLALRLVPVLETHSHRFDWLGVGLAGLGMLLLVFGIQEGHQYDWGTIRGPVTVWRLIVAGIVVLGVFVWWQAHNRREPLVPLRIFRDRNFSVSTLAITTMSFTATGMAFPLMLYAQLVRGLTPTGAALLMVPMALMSIVMAPIAGRLTDRLHPRLLTSFGFLSSAGALYWLSTVTRADSATWEILVPMGIFGIGTSFTWGPLAATATRNLPPQLAGAGSGVYNAVRQVGAVLGSAAIAVLMDSRLAAHLPGMATAGSPELAGQGLPVAVREPFAAAMSETLLLPVGILLVGLVTGLLYKTPRHLAAPAAAD